MATARSERITFTGADGASNLAARLDLPAGEPQAYALFAHCFTCSSNMYAVRRIAEGLTAHRFAVLRFDFTGLGSSEGDFANTNFSSNVADLLEAAAWLRRERQAPSVLVGHSLGGAAVLAAAESVPEAKSVCTIGAPADPAHVAHLIQGGVDQIEATGEAEVCIANRPFRIQKQLLDDISSQRQEERIRNLKRALLVFHGPRDETVGIENATRIFVAAKHPKSFVSLDKADHLLSRPEDAVYVGSVIAAWAKRYLDAEAPEEDLLPKADVSPNPAVLAGAPAAEAGTVRVVETGNGHVQQTVSVGGRHTMLADEPVDYGGTDTGPSPYDYLLAGLGACTSMTIRLYAARKQWPLDKVDVTLRHAKIHATDCADCETKAGKIDRIEREIVFHGPLDDAQKAKLLEIADKCPVHRTLHSEVQIITALKS
jgi:putative redox protein